MARKNGNEQEPLVLERVDVGTSLFERTKSRLAKSALCGVLMAQVFVAGEVSDDLWRNTGIADTSITNEKPDRAVLPPLDLDQCPAPTFGASILAHQLVTRGDTIARQKEWRGSWHIPSETELASSDEEADAARYNMRKKAADHYGLTVHDSRPYSNVLWEDLRLQDNRSSNEIPTAGYLSLANEFLARYGVEIELPTELSKENKKRDLEPITPQELEDRSIKHTAYRIMEVFAALPEEYIRQVVGLKKVLLVSGEDAEVAGLAYVSGAHDTIVLHAHGASREVIWHEIAHLADAALCGGYEAATRDPAYVAHNPPFTKSYGQKNPTSHNDIEWGQGDWQSGGDAQSEQLRHITACLRAAHIAEKYTDVSLVSDYSGENPIEDKAETGLYILDPDGRVIMTGYTMPPRVRGKYETLVARLADAHSGMAGYFTAMQYLPDDTSTTRC